MAASSEAGPAAQASPARPAPPEAIVELHGVGRSFGSYRAVGDVDLAIRRGEFFTLLGPSGSGKTTVLRLIAGLLEPSEGRVVIEGVDVSGARPHQRNVGLVFQSLALFPHMDVFGNVAFPLRMQRVGRREIARRVGEALQLVRLPDVEHRQVDELSGGQRQRVALARALVYRPPLLLLDEPLGALDRRLREDMQVEFMRLHQEIDVTIVNVTHDQREALMLSDRIGILDQGELVQVAAPERLYREPATRFVASFLGDPTLIEGRVHGGWLVRDGLRLRVAPSDVDGAAVLVLRSEDVDLHATEPPDDNARNVVGGSIRLSAFEGLGTYYQVALHGGGPTVNVFAARDREAGRLAPGDDVFLSWCVDDAPVLASEGKRS